MVSITKRAGIVFIAYFMNTFPQYIKRSLASIGMFTVVFIQAAPVVAYATSPVDVVHTVYDTSIVKDSYVDQDSSGNSDKDDINYATANSIEVKSSNGKNRRMFIQANTPSIPAGAVLQSVRLYVYMYNRPSTSIRLYSISQVMNSWDENTITWNNQPSASTTPIAIHGISPVNNSWVMFEVTADVKSVLAGQSVNNGWVIQDKFESSRDSYLAEFRSREYSSNNACGDSPSTLCRPYLEIRYTIPSGVVTGNVWDDINGNGVKDESELPKSGEEIVIYSNNVAYATTTTAGNGVYNFSQLPLGQYTVCRSTTNTTEQTFPQTGVVCPGNTYGGSVEVSGGEIAGPDFGVFNASAVTVILSTNPGVTEDSFDVSLVRDTATTTHTFSEQGEFVFDGLISGTYSLSNVLPSSWLNQSVSCLQNEVSVSPTSFSVSPEYNTVCTIDLVKAGTVSVTNYVNPVQGTYSYTLIKGDNESVLGPVVVGNDVTHLFTALFPGTYTLSETIDADPVGETAVCFIGNTIIDPRTGSFEIPAGASIQCTYNHGEVSAIQGSVFEDMDGNTVRDTIDVSLSGWLVNLYKVTEESVVPQGGDTPIPTEVSTYVTSQTTDETGYVFGQLSPGTYKVCEELKPNFIQSLPLSNEGCEGTRGYTFAVDFGDIANKHFGNFGLAKLSGVVFSDLNNNGARDEGEPGLSGITVSIGTAVTTTNTNGEYQFTELMPGNYPVTISGIPANSSYSVPSTGNYALVAFSRGDYTDKDFGIFTDTDVPALPVHLSPADGAVVKPAGLVLDWTDVVDPSGSAVSYKYQSALSNATTTGNALSTPIYNATLSSSQIDASGTSDGTYFWQVKACDTANNCTDWTNPWSLTVDSVLPTSIFTAPASSTSITGDFITITGSTTDTHGVASTSLLFAPWTPGEGENPGSCGAYSHIVSLVNTSSTNPFDWTFNWTPTENGVYCITAQGQDSAGNVETSTVITNISFTKATTTDGGNGGGSNGGGGSGGSGGSSGGSSGSNGGGGGSNGGGAGGNGPIVGSFGGGFGVGGDAGGNTGSTGTNTGNTGNAGNTGAAGGTVLTGTEGGFGGGDLASSAGMTDLDTYYGNTTSTPTTTISDADDNTDQVAAVGFLGGWSNWYWLWILLLIIIILGVYYSTRRRENK